MLQDRLVTTLSFGRLYLRCALTFHDVCTVQAELGLEEVERREGERRRR